MVNNQVASKPKNGRELRCVVKDMNITLQWSVAFPLTAVSIKKETFGWEYRNLLMVFQSNTGAKRWLGATFAGTGAGTGTGAGAGTDITRPWGWFSRATRFRQIFERQRRLLGSILHANPTVYGLAVG